LGAVSGGVAEPVLETGVEGNGVERHLDADRGGELGANPAHAFSSGAFALGAFPFDHEDVFASGAGEVVGDAGAYDACSDDDYVSGLHCVNATRSGLLSAVNGAL
jgi:hypothetical protein